MRNTIITFVALLLTFAGTYSLWASDKKDIQQDKITKLQTEMETQNKAWDRREVLDTALLTAINKLNILVTKQTTKMDIYHPESKLSKIGD